MRNIAQLFTEKKMNNFWSSMSKIRGNKRGSVHQMDGFNDETDILRIFTMKYNTVYNSIGYDSEEMDDLLQNTNYNIIRNCQSEVNSDDHLHIIDVKLVTKVAMGLKRGKSDGVDGLTSDYIINGTDSLYLYIYIICLTP